ncbi:MAG: hypothetical protein B7Y41_13665 [Hydrogenophilales bacterium 28-61-23]|nr:MAG: hypothetical protein B7Y41_13665 [Hydrogenophilales bacterium 28-61-23]
MGPYRTILILSLSLLSACSMLPERHAKPDASAPPAWINNPGEGVAASAMFHVRGAQAQEELAITRARDEYAKRYGVIIDSEHLTEMHTQGDRTTSVSDKAIQETVKQKEVKATVKEKWKDPQSGVLWIWLVPAK